MKFIPGVQVLKEGTFEFKDKVSAKRSNLANLIFLIDGIERVFLATEFVSVTKNNESNWEILKPLILTSIMDHYASGKEVIEKNYRAAPATNESEPDGINIVQENAEGPLNAIIDQIENVKEMQKSLEEVQERLDNLDIQKKNENEPRDTTRLVDSK